MKKEKQEEQQKVEECSRSQEELVPPPTPEPDIDPDEDLELSGEGEDDIPEKNGDIVRCGLMCYFALKTVKLCCLFISCIFSCDLLRC